MEGLTPVRRHRRPGSARLRLTEMGRLVRLGTRVFTNPSCGVYTGPGSGVSAFMLPPNQSAEFLRLRSSTLSGLYSRRQIPVHGPTVTSKRL